MPLLTTYFRGCLFLFLVAVFAEDHCSKPPPKFAPRECCEPVKWSESNVEDKCAGAPSAVCFTECIFNSTDIIQNDGPNATNIRTFFEIELKADPDYIPIAINNFEMCYSLVKRRMEDKDHQIDGCDTFPALIMECTIAQMFVDCPSEKWKSSEACELARKYYKRCPDRHFTTNA
ncbi:uncharacterized protein LOC119661578 [Hermetia illucens]|uniref:uncharacterized protein LOC119661578 n=1 Tax=Hermetia illucens TaxID=343691 RepID=UPI0018CBFE39|nr:uncharacterized protein LOC119661578 [Hermetia illucens]